MANTLAPLCDSWANRCQRDGGLLSGATGAEPRITMELIRGWPEESFCVLLSGVLVASLHHEHRYKRLRNTQPVLLPLSGFYFCLHAGWEKTHNFQWGLSRLSNPAHSIHFLFPLFLPSHSLCLILSLPFSHPFFCSRPAPSQPGWLRLRPSSRVEALLLAQLLVELKGVPAAPFPLLPASLSAAPSSSSPHCLEREGIQKVWNCLDKHLCSVCSGSGVVLLPFLLPLPSQIVCWWQNGNGLNPVCGSAAVDQAAMWLCDISCCTHVGDLISAVTFVCLTCIIIKPLGWASSCRETGRATLKLGTAGAQTDPRLQIYNLEFTWRLNGGIKETSWMMCKR